uniref:leishmanolysin-like peptidase n=1 Tax=Myxine glutinosa TaxID=7769 RepID=UPI00358E0BC2
MVGLFLMLGSALTTFLLFSIFCRASKHWMPQPHEIVLRVPVQLSLGPIKRHEARNGLRVKPIYHSSLHSLSDRQRDRIMNVLLPDAVGLVARALRVRKSVAKLRLARQCATRKVFFRPGDTRHYCQSTCANVTYCGPVPVPEEHLQRCQRCSELGQNCGPVSLPDGPGEAHVDFLLYVSAKNTVRCQGGSTVAYAAHCQQGQDDRPIAGYANVCPEALAVKHGKLTVTALLHEILHALGFSASLFAFYRDNNGQPLTPRRSNGLPAFNASLGLYQWSEKVVRHVERLWLQRDGHTTHEVSLLVTPNVMAEGRKHFGCPSLEGVELENQGGVGTELNHWEMRLLGNEVMTGAHTTSGPLSRLTLALMEDTGWYWADYSMAQKLSWGFQLGCLFAQGSCLEWVKDRHHRGLDTWPFCISPRVSSRQLTCGAHHASVTRCNLRRHRAPLPHQYQYFEVMPWLSAESAARVGGGVELADFCPFGQEIHQDTENQHGIDCTNVENQPDSSQNEAHKEFGNGYFCLRQEAPPGRCWTNSEQALWGAGCYQVSCSPEGLAIWVGGHSYPCHYDGQRVAVKLGAGAASRNGSLVCPLCCAICSQCPSEPNVNNWNGTSLALHPWDSEPCSGSPAMQESIHSSTAKALQRIFLFVLLLWAGG